MFIYGLDISLGSYGGAIADEDYNIKRIGTIKTKSIMSTPNRLDMIGDVLLQLKVKYPPKLVLIEQGFTKFNKSTQQIFRVHGITNLAFKNIEQITYTPLTLKKLYVILLKQKRKI